MRAIITAAALCAATSAAAQTPDIGAIVEGHVLPGYRALVTEGAALAAAAQADCTPGNAALQAAYNGAFDAWIGVSHLRFGPSEENDRAFALAFWPDPRGATAKTLGTLLRDEDPVVNSEDEYATVSVAARGFFALEFLLFDPQFTEAENTDYLCALTQAVASDIARSGRDILAGWEGGYADLMTSTGNDTYRSDTEAAQQFFTALSTGLEFTADARLTRPLGTFERPRPARAEARRSGRSLRNVTLSLEATRELASLLSGGDAEVDVTFADALTRAADLDDPDFSGVADPGRRVRVEALRNDVNAIRKVVAEDLGPRLGVAAGFNSLDGD